MIKFSLFNPPVQNLSPSETIVLSALFEMIRTDKSLKEKIKTLRGLKEKVQRDNYKKSQLLGVTFCGTFSKRLDKDLITHSSIVCVDIDGLAVEQMGVVKESLEDIYKEIVGYFISPSGNGYKILIRVDNNTFSNKDNYLAAVRFLQANIEIPNSHFDLACSNVSRLTFLPYDEDAYLNESVLLTCSIDVVPVLDTDRWLKDIDKEKTEKAAIVPISFENPYQRNGKLDYQHREERINFNILISITTQKKGEYKNGNRHNFIQCLSSMANQFGMSEKQFTAYCSEYFKNHPETLSKANIFDIENELLPLVKDTYKRYASQFRTLIEDEQNEIIETPYFPEELYEKLPDLLRKPTLLFKGRERDVLLIGFLGCLSTWFPKVQALYDGKLISANLFIIISAPASAGKGVLHWPRKITLEVREKLKHNFEIALEEYELALKEYEASKNDGGNAIKPIKPMRQKFIIPANISSAAMIGVIQANKHFGLIFETEADTLVNTLRNKEWGDFTDLLRKCFHNEPVSLLRKKDNEEIEIEKSYLSMILSGTPDQIKRLVSNVENGFFSRLLYYDFPNANEWKNVFEKKQEDYERYFNGVAMKLESLLGPYFYNKLDTDDDIVLFEFTKEQEVLFNEWFTDKQESLNHIYGDEIIASVRRLAVCFFRIALILSVIRHVEMNEESAYKIKKIICSDKDYRNAELIIDTLIYHTLKIFKEVKRGKRNKFSKNLKETFLEKLPPEFNRRDAMSLAGYLGIKEKTAENYLSKFIEERQLSRVNHNQYSKSN